jgi:hypothetical protein
MTPEEIRQRIEFIVNSQASASVRADRFEEQLEKLRTELDHQKENIDGLMRLAQQLLELARVERETRKVEIEAERAKIDRVEEMTKVLRELLEANLRRPEEPPPAGQQ